MGGSSRDRETIEEKIEKRMKNEAARKRIGDAHKKEIFAAEEALKTAMVFMEKMGQSDTPLKVVATLLFVKAFNTFWATFVLCKEGLAFEAATNARTLLELSISLAWLVKENSDYRAERCVAFEMVWRGELYETHLRYQSEPSEREKLKKMIEYNEQLLEKAKKELGLTEDDLKKSHWSGKSIKKRAEDIDLVKDYELVYSQLSEIEHSGSGSLPRYGHYEDDQIRIFPGPLDKWIHEILMVAFNYFYLAFSKAVHVLEGDGSPLEELRPIFKEAYGDVRLTENS